MSCTVTEGCSHWPKIKVCLGVGDVSGQLGAGGRSASSLPNRQLRHCDVPASGHHCIRKVSFLDWWPLKVQKWTSKCRNKDSRHRIALGHPAMQLSQNPSGLFDQHSGW